MFKSVSRVKEARVREASWEISVKASASYLNTPRHSFIHSFISEIFPTQCQPPLGTQVTKTKSPTFMLLYSRKQKRNCGCGGWFLETHLEHHHMKVSEPPGKWRQNGVEGPGGSEDMELEGLLVRNWQSRVPLLGRKHSLHQISTTYQISKIRTHQEDNVHLGILFFWIPSVLSMKQNCPTILGGSVSWMFC